MPRRTSKPPMKNYGAQPFDEKEWGITREQLHDEMRRFGDNTAWCHRNEEMLRKKYPDRWVVVEDGEVIVADPDHAKILKMLRARPKGIDAAYIHFISKVKYNLVV